MRIATWNVNSLPARMPRVLEWLAGCSPDVLCLQETKIPADSLAPEPFAELGYQLAAYGSGRWNGVAILSRIGLEDVRRGFPGEPGYGQPPVAEARALAATCGGLRLWSLYVPNGRTLDSDHYAYKLAWLEALRVAVTEEGVAPDRTMLLGDFNVAPTDADVWDPAVFVGCTHVTPAERGALQALREVGFADVIPAPQKGPNPFTYWDYRAGAFPKDMGMRIDLVYAGEAVARAVTGAYIDRAARKGQKPSDHAPVVVDLREVPVGVG